MLSLSLFLQRTPISHKVIEKRRRDRINRCLNELGKTVPMALAKQVWWNLSSASVQTSFYIPEVWVSKIMFSVNAYYIICSCNIFSQTSNNDGFRDIYCRTLENWRRLKSWKWRFSICEHSTQQISPVGEKRVSSLLTEFWHFTHPNRSLSSIKHVTICSLLIRHKRWLAAYSCKIKFNITCIYKSSVLRIRPQAPRYARLSQGCNRSFLWFIQANCWLSSQTTFTTDITSAWRTWCTTWPRRTELKPKTSSTHGYSLSYSPSPVWSPSPCSAPSARCQNRLTTSASCTPPRSTKATARLTQCISRVHRDTSPGTARPAALGSPTQLCLCLRTRSSTADTCHRCRDSITTISTSSVTRTQTRLVCTVRNTPCK